MLMNIFVFVLISLLMIVLISIGSTWGHEAVHVAAYQNYGIDSTIGVDLGSLRAFTQADNNELSKLDMTDRRFIRLENSINESVQYNTSGYFIGIMGLLVVGFIYLGSKIENLKQ